MKNISETKTIPKSELYYYRAVHQNNIQHDIMERFLSLAESEGLTQKMLANIIGKDKSYVNRVLTEPTNLTIDTISDLLRGMDAVLAHKIVPIGKESMLSERSHDQSQALLTRTNSDAAILRQAGESIVGT